MHGPKDNQPRKIAQKYSLDYYRRALPTRSWKWWWNWTFLMVSLLSVAGLYLVRRDQPFQAAPVSSAHASFGANCADCHDQSWQTALRLVTLDDSRHSVSDAACQECHRAAPHVPQLLVDEACVSCHQEHRPGQSLTQLADSNCTHCHRDLDAHLAGASFAATITQFAAGDGGHPEFALLRATNDGVGTRHRAQEVAEFRTDAEGRRRWHDRGGVAFNHALHLADKGVLDADRKTVHLKCADCHVPDAAGATMRPIVYETHCARCHAIQLGAPLELRAEIDTTLPHASVEQVRGVIRERLARMIEQQAAGGADAPTTPADRGRQSLRLPLLPRPARLTADEEGRLATLMEAADHSVFGYEAKAGCRFCHQVVPEGGSWAIVPGGADGAAMIPMQWLLHGKFDHEAHRAVECASCHQVQQSTATADILLPSISVCRECHGTTMAGSSVTRVRDDCVLCHTFHADGHLADGVSLDRLFRRTKETTSSPQ